MHHIIFDFFTGMDGTGHALEGLEVPIKDKTFFTIFFEVDDRMRRVLKHHRVHKQASLCDIALKTKDRLLCSCFPLCWIPVHVFTCIQSFFFLSFLSLCDDSCILPCCPHP